MLYSFMVLSLRSCRLLSQYSASIMLAFLVRTPWRVMPHARLVFSQSGIFADMFSRHLKMTVTGAAIILKRLLFLEAGGFV